MKTENAIPALFIGRFQPFHLGHLDAIKQILENHKHLLIGIGSFQYEGQEKNPFSGAQRVRMIEASLEEEGITPERVRIIPIPDIHNDEVWVGHVEKLCPPFGRVYSGTPYVQKLFQKDGKHRVQSPKFNIQISGTKVRKQMVEGKNWQSLVPNSVEKLLRMRLPR